MMTKRQTQVYDYIKTYNDKYGTQPTLSEIAKALNIKSVSTVHEHIEKLVKQGHLNKGGNYASIAVSQNSKSHIEVEIEGYLELDKPFKISNKNLFGSVMVESKDEKNEYLALIVRGDGLEKEGILDGDTVVLKKQSFVAKNQIGIALTTEKNLTISKGSSLEKGNQFLYQTKLLLSNDSLKNIGVIDSVHRSFNSKKPPDNKFKVMDLFCGIGGFSKGFEKAGFDIEVGIDNWKIALETFSKNHQKTKAILSNLEEFTDQQYHEYAGEIDVIIGGPPCQGFSMSGKRDPNDIRNTLFKEMIRSVQIVKPKVVVLENVVGLLSMKDKKGHSVKDLIISEFERLGYEVEYQILDASKYGVPQARRRVIFIASRIGKINFPAPKKTQITVGQALGNIPPNGTKYSTPTNTFQKIMSGTELITNHRLPNHNQAVTIRMSKVPQGGNWQDIPPEFYGVGGVHSNNYRRLDPDKPSVTLKHAGKSMIIHPHVDRGLTIREVARLQAFDDNFELAGSVSDQHQQLANAVPPLLAYAVAKQIKQTLEKPKKINFKFIDLFSGIGGFRIALEGVGGKCVFSSDIDKWANKTYLKNFGESPAGDIKKIKSADIPEHDILTAGFPCQPFSVAGRRKGFEDTRGTLFFDVARILKDKQPKAFILENVKGIVNHDGGKTLEVILKTLDQLGYEVFMKVLNSKDFGVPQNRERWICVGILKSLKKNYVFPEPIKLKKTLKNILQNDTPEDISTIAKKHLKNHLKSRPKKPHSITIATEIRPSRCILRDDGISPCLTAKMGTGGNNIPIYAEKMRKYTVDECLAIQGFPKSFKMPDSSYQSYKQIGNSVTVPLIKSVAKNLVDVLY